MVNFTPSLSGASRPSPWLLGLMALAGLATHSLAQAQTERETATHYAQPGAVEPAHAPGYGNGNSNGYGNSNNHGSPEAGPSYGGRSYDAPSANDGEDPPARVGRVASLQGEVWIYDQAQGQWQQAQRNQAISTGERVSTERGARIELRIGSSEVRLGESSELIFEQLGDSRIVIRLVRGSAALRVRQTALAREFELRTGEVRVLPTRSGHYRLDRDGEVSTVTAWRGSARAETRDQQVPVTPGQRAEFFREPRENTTAVTWGGTVKDAFSDWVARSEVDEERSPSARYVSPEMTGAEELDRYGRWDRHPEYGMVWFPLQVAVGWAPYRHGRWTWAVRFGWTWVDDAPWGFAPSHYGRWVNWGGRWGWTPGAYVQRPVYSPALVAWIGGPQASISINLGGRTGPGVGWLPLAPRDTYVPGYRHGRGHFDRVNQPHHPKYPPQVPTGPVMYGNQGVPSAVTVVPSNVLLQRQPVAPAVVREQDVHRPHGQVRFQSQQPVAAPAAVVMVPGGAEPVRPPGAHRDAGRPGPGDAARRGQGDAAQRGAVDDAQRSPVNGSPRWRTDPAAPVAPAVQVLPQGRVEPAPQRRLEPVGPGRQFGPQGSANGGNAVGTGVAGNERERAMPSAQAQPAQAQPVQQPMQTRPVQAQPVQAQPTAVGAPVFRSPSPVQPVVRESPQRQPPIERSVAPIERSAPPVERSAPAIAPVERERAERRGDGAAAPERQQRMPESRGNGRERQNVQ